MKKFAFERGMFDVMVGRAIARRRRSLGITQEDLGMLIGKSRNFIGRVENGLSCKLENFDAICNVLNIKMEELISWRS